MIMLAASVLVGSAVLRLSNVALLLGFFDAGIEYRVGTDTGDEERDAVDW